jgi:hypothetical protein
MVIRLYLRPSREDELARLDPVRFAADQPDLALFGRDDDDAGALVVLLLRQAESGPRVHDRQPLPLW